MSSFSRIIPPSVLLSPRARWFYKLAAAGTEMFLLVLAYIVLWIVNEDSDSYALPAKEFLRTLLFIGAISFGALAVAMQNYLSRFDRSSTAKRSIWFLAFVLTWPFGVLAYFYSVYLPQTRKVPTEEEEFFTAGM
jgi:phage shock protein PspC (stress-responsive transcriptional regulator)